MNLQELRKEWEEGLEPLVVVRQPEYARVLVILQLAGPKALADIGAYHLHRYFEFGNKVDVSVDGRNVPLEAVWSWLNNPSAMSTFPENYSAPMEEPNETLH